MHRHVREHLEEVLAASKPLSATGEVAGKHLADCRECNDEVTTMRAQASLLRGLRAAEETEPRAGFYARVLERIEAEGPASIWNLFFDSALGHRLAIASLALAALLCVCLISIERFSDAGEVAQDARGRLVFASGEDQPGVMLTGGVDSGADEDAVLVNLVTYREQ